MKLFFYLFTCIFSFELYSQVSMITNIGSKLNSNTTYTVQVKIAKGAIANFSKYQVDVPAGMIASEGDSKTGNFTFENNRAKIVWVSIPVETEFVLSYILNTGATNGSLQFLQKFYYLDNGVKKEVEADIINVTLGSDGPGTLPLLDNSSPVVVANNNTNSSPTPTETVANNISSTNSVTATNTSENKTITTTTSVNTTAEQPKETVAIKETVVVKEPVIKNTNKEIKLETTSGLVYRIQLGAFSTSPSKAKFANAGKVEINNEDGMYKVLVGKFTTKEDALKKRDELVAKGISGFVASYQNGIRVK